jgi:hypothetical protein
MKPTSGTIAIGSPDFRALIESALTGQTCSNILKIAQRQLS